MAQDDGEIKMNLPGRQTINHAVSRDGKPRHIYKEEKLQEKVPNEVDLSSSRREFFNAVLPASSKVLTNILRSVQSTFAVMVDEARIKRK